MYESDEETKDLPKHERVSPCSRDRSQSSLCSCVPNFPIISIFPVSGAEQLIASAQNRHLKEREIKILTENKKSR